MGQATCCALLAALRTLVLLAQVMAAEAGARITGHTITFTLSHSHAICPHAVMLHIELDA